MNKKPFKKTTKQDSKFICQPSIDTVQCVRCFKAADEGRRRLTFRHKRFKFLGINSGSDITYLQWMEGRFDLSKKIKMKNYFQDKVGRWCFGVVNCSSLLLFSHSPSILLAFASLARISSSQKIVFLSPSSPYCLLLSFFF